MTVSHQPSNTTRADRPLSFSSSTGQGPPQLDEKATRSGHHGLPALRGASISVAMWPITLIGQVVDQPVLQLKTEVSIKIPFMS